MSSGLYVLILFFGVRHWMCMDHNVASGKRGKSCLFAAVKWHLTCDVGSQNLLIFLTARYGLFFFLCFQRDDFIVRFNLVISSLFIKFPLIVLHFNLHVKASEGFWLFQTHTRFFCLLYCTTSLLQTISTLNLISYTDTAWPVEQYSTEYPHIRYTRTCLRYLLESCCQFGWFETF